MMNTFAMWLGYAVMSGLGVLVGSVLWYYALIALREALIESHYRIDYIRWKLKQQKPKD